MAWQTISLPRPIVKVYKRSARVWGQAGEFGGVTYHTVTGKVRVGVQDTVGSRVVAGSVHGIRSSLVKRRLHRLGSIAVLEWRSWVNMCTHRESDVPRRGLCDGNHDV